MSKASKPKTGRITIYDVAAHAGVSKSLVSLVLKGDERVSDARRQKVEAAIAALGYRPSRAAVALAGKKSGTIGVVIDSYSNLWFVRMLRGLRSVLDQHGYQITVSDLHSSDQNNDDPIDGFLSMHVDGIVIATEPSNLRTRPMSVPCVVVGGRKSKLVGADSVSNDDFEGSAKATRYLIDLGHKKIAHVSAGGGAGETRMNGYLAEINLHKLTPIFSSPSNVTDETSGFMGAKEIFENHTGVTAVFAANDQMAAGVFAYLKTIAKKVPGEISVIGFDNSPTSSEFMLDMSTVDYAGENIGLEAARLLLKRFDAPNRDPEHLILKTDLIIRGSTRALKSKK